MSGRGARLPVVVGPTASGKSTLAARLAQHLGGEVVSADSVQVYREFDIGSGKPTAAELSLAPHHLIDCADPHQPLEAQVWAARAHQVIAEIRLRNNLPIVCGGTFLWVRALLFGLADAPGADQGVRARHRALVAEKGRAHLHELLAEVDVPSAARLHPHDFVRVSRALEVFELSGRRLSDIQKEHGFRDPRYDAILLRIDWPIEQYEERLRTRVRSMLKGGLRAEVSSLLSRGYAQARAMDSVGYKQVKYALLSDNPPDDATLQDEIVRVTRIFARRQRTWLRDERVVSVSPQSLVDDSALSELAESLRLTVP